jgi:magnesium chelatase family protein
MAAITGGGNRAKPGEVSLAHRGVLFMDEIPEFPRPTLEALRQPLEAGHTTVARAAAHITYPARFQLVAAMNPCRCGYLGDGARECGRAPRCGEDYQSRLSGPLLDRIDIIIEITPLSPAELTYAPEGEPTRTVAARVAAARQTPRRCKASSTSPARRKRSWRSRQPSFASRRAASSAPCASGGPSRTSPGRKKCKKATSPRR